MTTRARTDQLSNTDDEYYSGWYEAEQLVALMGLHHAKNLADEDETDGPFVAGFRAYVESLVQS